MRRRFHPFTISSAQRTANMTEQLNLKAAIPAERRTK
jgi:hypothetical protein